MAVSSVRKLSRRWSDGSRERGPRTRVLAWAALSLLVGGVAAAGCTTDTLTAARTAPAPAPKEFGLRAFGPARYVEQSSRWIERTPSGTDYVILNGRRAELKGAKIVQTAPGEIEIDYARQFPAWVKGPARYAMWKGRDLYLATTFLGEPVKIATVPQDSLGDSFDWVDGLAYMTDAGPMLLAPGTAADLKDARFVKLALTGIVDGLAADATRAILGNVFGRTTLTIDGGKTFRDVTEELGEARDFEVRGGDLVVRTSSGRERFIGPDGKISDAAAAPGARRGAKPPDLDDAWADFTSDDARYALAKGAIPIGEGVDLVVYGDKIVKVDAETTGIRSVTAIEDLVSTSCEPLKLSDAVLLACHGNGRATVIDVTGVPRVERTFDLARSGNRYELDAFSGADGIGLGFLGSCAGPTMERDDLDGVSGASQRNASAQKSAVFCARASADHWIEHRVPAEDGDDVIGWMPRPGGDAVALVARPGRVVKDEERVQTIGGLRIVRIPRFEPPIQLPNYSPRGSVTLSRDMRAGPDGTIEAWIQGNGYGSNTIAVTIDAQGRSRVRPAPSRIESIETAGPFAMSRSDDGRLYETIDWGKRWIEVKSPPGTLQNNRPTSCSAVGCEVNGFLRIGWDSVDEKIPNAVVDYETGRNGARVLREMSEYRRPPPKPTSARLVCSYAAPGEGARVPDSYGYGFGFAPNAPSGSRYGGISRLGWIGAYSLPWWGGGMPTNIDVDLAWIDPFDLDARVHRTVVPFSRAGSTVTHRPYEMKLGYVMDEEGRIDLVPTGYASQCTSGILEDAGIVLKIGKCLDDPAMGVRIKDRVLVGASRWSGYSLTAIDMPHAADGTAAVGTSLRDLRVVSTSSSPRGFTFGIGARAGSPIGVAVDGRGDTVLAPIDPNDGYIGEIEGLAPLSGLKIGTDAKCSQSDKLADGEARVLLPFDTAIGLAKGSLPGVWSTGQGGLAIVRWTKETACLEAVEMMVRDDRFDPDGSGYEGNGVLRKVIARFGKAPSKRALTAKEKDKKKPAKKAAPTASASASASASAAASASPVSPFGPAPAPTPSASTSASASASATVAPIPVAPPLPRGAGEGTLLVIQNGSEMRQKLFCTGITP